MEKKLEKPTDANPGQIRLNRYLAQCGLGSRRHCDEIIASGKVTVNGVKIHELGTKVDPAHDRVEFGSTSLSSVRNLEYFALHKPRDCIVTRTDPEGRSTIYDILKERGFDASHLNYVGRLDRNSEGLLLLTNDGAMIHALTHPRFQIKKVYRVRIDRRLSQPDYVKMINEGVESDGQVLRAGAIREEVPLPGGAREYWYEIDLFEGKNRQIRRMFEALEYIILRLKRIQYGSVKLGDAKRGEIRPLTDREKAGLLNTGYPAKSRHEAARDSRGGNAPKPKARPTDPQQIRGQQARKRAAGGRVPSPPRRASIDFPSR